MSGHTLADITIGQESETPRGWSYQVSLVFDDQSTADHTLALSWVDYEYWCGGDKPPSLVAERLLEAAFALNPELELPSTADASTLRRQIEELDQAVQARL